MAFVPWLLDGRVLTEDGALVLCDECPCISGTGTGTGTGTGYHLYDVFTNCCDVGVPSVLTLTRTGGAHSCFTATVPLYFNSSTHKWQSGPVYDYGCAGANGETNRAVSFLLYCSSDTWILELYCDGLLVFLNTPTTFSCDPFAATFNLSSGTFCFSDSLPITFTVTE